MRATLLSIAVLAAAPLGAPETVRVSRAGDERAHPGARTETWELTAVHPRTRRVALLRFRRAAGYPTVTAALPRDRSTIERVELPQTFARGDRAGARFAGPSGRSELSWRGRRIVVDVADAELRGRLTLRGRPGPYATSWDPGRGIRYPAGNLERLTVAYNVPVATGRLRGSLTVRGRTLRLDGWRGSWEHVWGSYSLEDDEWAFWDAYVVQRRDGTAWLAFGLNRRDTVTGDGARDAQWSGVLARAGPGGTRVCRPRIDRRAWAFGGAIGADPFAQRVTARCGRLRATFRDRGGTWLRDDHYLHFRQRAIAARGAGGVGLARHDSSNPD